MFAGYHENSVTRKMYSVAEYEKRGSNYWNSDAHRPAVPSLWVATPNGNEKLLTSDRQYTFKQNIHLIDECFTKPPKHNKGVSNNKILRISKLFIGIGITIWLQCSIMGHHWGEELETTAFCSILIVDKINMFV